MSERGLHIVVEGTDGTGKSTVVDELAERFESSGREVLRVDEPDSIKDSDGNLLVPMSAELRPIIKNGDLGRRAITSLFLFSASRGENWFQQSKPAITRGAVVLQARSHRSSEIYQGYTEGVDLNIIRMMTLLATDRQYMNPDLEVILDLDDEAERARRVAARGPLESPDQWESKGEVFQASLREGYRKLAQDEDILLLSANRPVKAITDDIWDRVTPLL